MGWQNNTKNQKVMFNSKNQVMFDGNTTIQNKKKKRDVRCLAGNYAAERQTNEANWRRRPISISMSNLSCISVGSGRSVEVGQSSGGQSAVVGRQSATTTTAAAGSTAATESMVFRIYGLLHLGSRKNCKVNHEAKMIARKAFIWQTMSQMALVRDLKQSQWDKTRTVFRDGLIAQIDVIERVFEPCGKVGKSGLAMGRVDMGWCGGGCFGSGFGSGSFIDLGRAVLGQGFVLAINTDTTSKGLDGG